MNLHNDTERFKEFIELTEVAMPHLGAAKIEKDYYRVFAFDYNNRTASLIYTSVPYNEVIKVISQIIQDGYFAGQQ